MTKLIRYSLFFFAVASFFIAQAQSYPQHSVLSDGTWYKIAINNDGIYKIGCEELGALEGKSIAHIGIFGNGGGMLPEKNSIDRYNDPQQNPVKVYDFNGNGVFDRGDYLLFYGASPNSWNYSDEDASFHYNVHAYSNYNYYYLNLNATNSKSIAVSPTPQTGASIGTVNKMTRVAVINEEANSINNTGRIWLGDKFTNASGTRQYTLSIPHLSDGTEIKLRYAFASNSKSASTFSIQSTSLSRQLSFESSRYYKSDNAAYTWRGANANSINYTISYSSPDALNVGYLDYLEINAIVPVSYSGGQTIMRNQQHIGESGVYTFEFQATATPIVWNITDPTHAVEMPVSYSSGKGSFEDSTMVPQTYILFDANSCPSPVSIKSMQCQDLHGTQCPDLLIVSHPLFLPQSQRIANLHNLIDGMDVLIVTPDEVYNEFSSGKQDPIAIREMLRMYYQRAQANSALKAPRYLLVFGKGSFDNRDILNSGLPTVVTYQSETSFDENSSYCGDDFFGYLEPQASGATSDHLQVGIGRIPARNSDEASLIVDKIENYMYHSDLSDNDHCGDWRNYVALIADDADPSSGSDSIFAHSSEHLALQIRDTYPYLNLDRMYADSYVQQSGAIGSYYPELNNALKQRMDYGCILVNYIGHGSIRYIGTERYMEQLDIAGYTNFNRLPIFITSTCSFGRYDMVDDICGAEAFLEAPAAGVAVISAARPISHVQKFNTDLCMQTLNPENRLGDALRIAKNNTPVSHTITLLGDPALRPDIPRNHIVITAVNDKTVEESRTDSAMVLSKVTISGEIQDPQGNRIEDFDGNIYPIVFDRERRCHTLANDNEGTEVAFLQQNNILFKGTERVEKGKFEYSFIVPRDVAYNYDFGKLSHYASSGYDDATGAYTNIMFGGFDTSIDLTPFRPTIRLFLNDTNFISGGTTDAFPSIYAILEDSVGINAVGCGIGHDITATLDNNGNSTIVLNNFFKTDLGDSRRGTIRYNFDKLSEGWHSLTLKAWNIYNYSNDATISFYVSDGEKPEIGHLYAMPNPARESTLIRIEHNCKGTLKDATINIYDLTGQLVRTFQPVPGSDSYAIPIQWDFCNQGGAKVCRGVYVVHAMLTTQSGEVLREVSKIVKMD